MGLDRRTFLGGGMVLPVALAAGCSDGPRHLTVYTTLARSITEQIARAVKEKTGLVVRFWRANSPELTKRVMLEAQRGNSGCDVIEVEAGFLTKLDRDLGCLRLLPADIQQIGGAPHSAVSRMRATCLAWNTKAIGSAAPPRSYADLLRPEFRKKIAIVATAVPWFYSLYKAWGHAKADEYFQSLAKQGVRASEGHSLTAELLAVGEFAVSPAMYEYKIATMKKAGEPVDFGFADPLLLEQSAWAIHVKSKNVAQSENFIRFMQRAGSNILREENMIAGSARDFSRAYPDAPDDFVFAEEINSSNNYREWADRMNSFFRSSEKFL